MRLREKNGSCGGGCHGYILSRSATPAALWHMGQERKLGDESRVRGLAKWQTRCRTQYRRRHLASRFAQFITVCRAYILAETLCYTASLASQFRAKRSVF